METAVSSSGIGDAASASGAQVGQSTVGAAGAGGDVATSAVAADEQSAAGSSTGTSHALSTAS